MKKHVTLVFEYETDEEMEAIRKMAKTNQCRAWSMDHEIVRVDMMRQAVEGGDTEKAMEFAQADCIMALLPELTTCA